MPIFTIETSYRLPIYRHSTYEADDVEQACRCAIEDDDWSGEKLDYEFAGRTYVSGIWRGTNAAYRGAALPIPSQFDDAVQRMAHYFELLLGVLKILARAPDLTAPDLHSWLPRAQAAIAKAEAILEDFLAEREGDAGADGVHILLRIREDAVRAQIAQVIEADPTLTRLAVEAVSGADIRAACLAVVECSDLSEEQGAAEFRAALAAIRHAERRRAPAG